MKDTISQAATLVVTYQCAYNPGFPLTFNYRPITTAVKYLDSMGDATPPLTNIYHEPVSHEATDSYVQRDDLNAKLVFDLFSGAPGCHTDFAGLVMITWFQNSPQQWYDLFRTKGERLSYSQVFRMIVGLDRADALRFINCSVDIFPDLTPNSDITQQDLTVATQETVLRSLLEF